MVKAKEVVTPAQISRNAMETIRYLAECVETSLKGSIVEVISDHNGQPVGHSRPSWRGQVCRIKEVFIDVHNGISLQLEGHEYECFIKADEVKFV